MLSRRERRILRGIERDLSVDDPDMARRLRSRVGGPPGAAGVLRLTAGLAILAAAVCVLLGTPQAVPTLLTIGILLIVTSCLTRR